ncbi:MAG: PAS domain S-box protein [Thermoanaerobaculaceae bacterium]|nr:PAS domain S-box protein [Thermoanaerobaculaceae bacterium]
METEGAGRSSLEANLIEMLPHAVVVLVDGRVRLANPAFEKLLGTPIREIEGRSIDDLFGAGDSGLGVAVLGGDPGATTSSLGRLPEYEIVRPDGQRRWVSVAARIVEHDGVAGLMLVLTDLTRLRHIEEDARRSHKAVETMRLGVTITDPHGRIIYTNPAQAGLCGANPAELCGLEGRVLAPRELWRPWPAERPEGWAHFARESVNQRRDGTTFPVHLTSDSIRDGEGRLIGWVTICEDLTDRKAAEEELRQAHLELEERVRERTADLEAANEALRREIAVRIRVEKDLEASERRYRTLAEDLDEVIFSLDTLGRITYISPVIEKLAGFSPDALVGSGLDALVQESDAVTLRSSLERTCAGSSQTVTLGLRTHDGGSLHVRLSTVPTLEAGAVIGVRGVLTDITERRRLEDQLLQSQKLEAVGRLAGGVAHDINNLLQAILGAVQSLQRREPTIAGELDEVVANIQRGAAVTRQLLLFARRGEARPECLDLNEALQHCSVLLRRLTRENIDFDMQLWPEPALVEIDRGQLEQVMMNLVVNAIDAMPAGGTLRVATGRSDDGGSWFEVTDTGCGMPPEVRSHIFEPFFTTKPPEEGTGLGLSVVLGIVTAHGGRLAVTSSVGIGTTFRVSLPGRAPRVELVSPTAPEPPARRQPGEVAVLVVEDDPLVRRAVEQTLTCLGYQATAVGSASEALRVTKTRRFDVLLTDLMLQDGRGDELAARLTECDPGLAVILMSGYSEVDSAEASGRGTLPGQFLQKPFRIEALGRALARALDRTSTGTP